VLMQGYGQNECLGMCTSLRKDERDPIHRLELLFTCGRRVAETQGAVLGDDGVPLPHGEIGELWLRPPVVMTAYHNQPEQTEKALRGGWLHTGDLAVCDGTGFCSIVGGFKDVIVAGGFNVSPREIEDVIATAAPGVLATAVIGLPHDKWGEVVTAFVVAREGQAVDVQALATIRTRKGPTRFRRRSTPWMSSHRPLPGRSTRTAARAAHDGELTFCRDQT